jgi:uncharacterized delta-60 repeat protein
VLLRRLEGGGADVSFGDKGQVVLDPVVVRRLDSVAVAPDGRIVVAGAPQFVTGTPEADSIVLRFNADGTPDATFGEAGRRVLTLGERDFGNDRTDVAVDAQGRVVLATTTIPPPDPEGTYVPSAFAVARLTAEGQLDPSFGGDGAVTAEIGPGGSVAHTVLLQPDGRIVVAGTWDRIAGHLHASDARFALARFNPDGSADATFGGGDGMAVANVNNQPTVLSGAVLRPDGRIFAAGAAYDTFHPQLDPAFASFNPDGSPDGSVWGDGTFIVRPGELRARINGAALAPDGSVFTTGGMDHWDAQSQEGDGRAMLVRVGPDATVRASAFQVSAGPGDSDSGESIALRPDGSLAIAGTAIGRGDGGEVADVFLARVSDLDQGVIVPAAPEIPDLPNPELPVPDPQGRAITIDGTAGNDVITVAARLMPALPIDPPRINLIVTVNGRRTLHTNAGGPIRSVLVRGGEGDDRIRVLNDLTMVGLAGSGETPPVPLVNVLIEGGTGNDFLRGPGNNDDVLGHHTAYTIRGDAGDDAIVGSPGDDTIDGGEGRDRARGRGGNDSIAPEDPRPPRGPLIERVGGAVLRLGRTGILTILATEGDDVITAVPRAADGAGGPYLDITVNGEVRSLGPATVALPAVSHVVIFARGGNDSVRLDPAITLRARVSGGAGDDRITTAAGNDVLLGGPGNDTLDGGTGDNRVVPGPGQLPLVLIY